MKNFISNLTQFFGNKEESEQNFHNEKVEDSTTSVKSMVCGVSSDRIDSLAENEIFVFGSNLAGMHGGGAARIAYNKFGAVWGQGVGLQGQSYAIPTMQGGVETIRPYVDEFIAFAKGNPQLKFLVTRIGCGIAGFRDEEIAPLFAECLLMKNVYLPQRFIKYLSSEKPKTSIINIEDSPLFIQSYGRINTVIDIIATENERCPIRDIEQFRICAEQAIKQLRDTRHDVQDVLFSKQVHQIIDSCFNGKGLDVDDLRVKLWKSGIIEETVESYYIKHGIKVLCDLVVLLDKYRNYKHTEQLLKDLRVALFALGEGTDKYILGNIFRAFVTDRIGEDCFSNGKLDSEKFIEKAMRQHIKRLANYGLDWVLANDYEPGSCHSWERLPKQNVIGPTYHIDKNGEIEKACVSSWTSNMNHEYFSTVLNRVFDNLLNEEYDIYSYEREHWRYDESVKIYFPLTDSTSPIVINYFQYWEKWEPTPKVSKEQFLHELRNKMFEFRYDICDDYGIDGKKVEQ